MLIPEVIGFKFSGKLPEGITATDLVLTVTQLLRAKGVVSKFVEFFGPGLYDLPLADRATISNMAPEYGATCGFFPVDKITLDYMRLTGRDEETIALIEAYCKAQGLWHDENCADPVFTDTLELDLTSVKPSLAGPRRPQDRVVIDELPQAFSNTLKELGIEGDSQAIPVEGESYQLQHGDVVIAAITSCTNTSNPNVLMAAGLLARNAIKKGLNRKPWVKTSLAPGSKVVTDYLAKAGLDQPLNDLGFNLVGYGCTTCIGNSGPLDEPISDAVIKGDLVVSSVLSGNRNFEGRIHPQVKANWLASPPLVVAYALAGNTRVDLTKDPLGEDADGKPVFLKDIWPSNVEIAVEVAKVDGTMFRTQYADVFTGDDDWKKIKVGEGKTYDWVDTSTYVRLPPYFEGMKPEPDPIKNIEQARILALFGDSITTDHISPAGSIKADSPAGKYLMDHGIEQKDLNSSGMTPMPIKLERWIRS